MELHVLKSTSLKSKKPWSSFQWVNEKNIFANDKSRIGLVDVTSGKVKKKIPKLHHFFSKFVHCCLSENGSYLVGLLNDGNLILWSTSANVVVQLDGFENLSILKTEKSKCYYPPMFISNKGSTLVIVAGFNKVFLLDNIEHNCIKFCGKWIYLSEPPNIILPNLHSKEMDVAFTFLTRDSILGDSVIGSFMFNVNKCLSLVSLNYGSCMTKKKCVWNVLSIPHNSIVNNFEPVCHSYAYISCYSHSGCILAIVANQLNPFNTRLLFVDPTSEAIMVSNLNGCSSNVNKRFHNRNFWVSSIKWSFDDQFLILITRQGSVCFVSRLGQLITISSKGFNLDKSMSSFLCFHPLITVIRNNGGREVEDNSVSEYSSADRFKQKFTVQTHPTMPLLLCSDGYMLTILQIPADWIGLSHYCKIMLRSVFGILEVSEYGRKCLKMPTMLENSTANESKRYPIVDFAANLEETLTLHSSMDSSSYINDMTGGCISGKIVFSEYIENKQHSSALCFQDAWNKLLGIWGLIVSTHDRWKKSHTYLVELAFTASQLMFNVLLREDCRSPFMNGTLTKETSSTNRMQILFCLISRIISMLKFDRIHRNFIFHFVKYIPSFFKLLDKSKTLKLEIGNVSFFQKLVLFACKMEISFHNVYAVGSKLAPNHLLQDNFSLQNSDLLLDVWSFVYVRTLKYHHRLKKSAVNKALVDDILDLICVLQKRLQSLGVPINDNSFPKPIDDISSLFIAGKKDVAIDMWHRKVEKLVSEMYDNNVESDETCSILHSLLYAMLSSGQLPGILELLDYIISSESNLDDVLKKNLDADYVASLNSVRGLQFNCIRTVLQSFARFFAMFFTSQELYVYPPHAVSPLPSLLSSADVPIKLRKCFIKREFITHCMRNNKLEDLITPDTVAELLILTGLHSESAWFAHTLGDWKASLLISGGFNPEKFSFSSILMLQLHDILGIDDSETIQHFCKDEKLHGNLQELLLASTFLNGNHLIEICELLMSKLSLEIFKLDLKIHNLIYLPAPPLFCLQECPDENEELSCAERMIRKRIFYLTKIILSVFVASVMVVPSALSYLNELQKLLLAKDDFEIDVSQMLSETITLLEGLRYSGLSCSAVDDHKEDLSIQKILKMFRHLCLVHWVLRSRDMFGYAVRKFNYCLHNETLCVSLDLYGKEALFYGGQLLSIIGDHNWKESILSTISSIALDLKPSKEVLFALTNCFSFHGLSDKNIDHRLMNVLQSWDRYHDISESDCRSFVDLFNKISSQFLMERKEKNFGSVFFSANDHKESFIGDRSAESTTEYLKFLALFYDLCVIKEVEALEDGLTLNSLPIISTFTSELMNKHLPSLTPMQLQETIAPVKSSISSLNLFRSKSQSHLNLEDNQNKVHKINKSVDYLPLRDQNDGYLNPLKQVTFLKNYKSSSKRWISSYEMKSRSSQNVIAACSLNESKSLPTLNQQEVENDTFESCFSQSMSHMKQEHAGSLPTARIEVLINYIGKECSKLASILVWLNRLSCKLQSTSTSVAMRINVTVPKILTAIWLSKNDYNVLSLLQKSVNNNDENTENCDSILPTAPSSLEIDQSVHSDSTSSSSIILPASEANDDTNFLTYSNSVLLSTPASQEAHLSSADPDTPAAPESNAVGSPVAVRRISFEEEVIVEDSAHQMKDSQNASLIDECQKINPSSTSLNETRIEPSSSISTNVERQSSLITLNDSTSVACDTSNQSINTGVIRTNVEKCSNFDERPPLDYINRQEFEALRNQQRELHQSINGLEINLNNVTAKIIDEVRKNTAKMNATYMRTVSNIQNVTEQRDRLRSHQNLVGIMPEFNDSSLISHNSAEGLVIRQSAEREDDVCSENDLSTDISEILTHSSFREIRSTLKSLSKTSNSQSECKSNRGYSSSSNLNAVRKNTISSCIKMPLLQIKPNTQIYGPEDANFAPKLLRNEEKMDDLENLIQVVKNNHSRLVREKMFINSRGRNVAGPQHFEEDMEKAEHMVEIVKKNHIKLSSIPKLIPPEAPSSSTVGTWKFQVESDGITTAGVKEDQSCKEKPPKSSSNDLNKFSSSLTAKTWNLLRLDRSESNNRKEPKPKVIIVTSLKDKFSECSLDDRRKSPARIRRRFRNNNLIDASLPPLVVKEKIFPIPKVPRKTCNREVQTDENNVRSSPIKCKSRPKFMVEVAAQTISTELDFDSLDSKIETEPLDTKRAEDSNGTYPPMVVESVSEFGEVVSSSVAVETVSTIDSVSFSKSASQKERNSKEEKETVCFSSQNNSISQEKCHPKNFENVDEFKQKGNNNETPEENSEKTQSLEAKSNVNLSGHKKDRIEERILTDQGIQTDNIISSNGDHLTRSILASRNIKEDNLQDDTPASIDPGMISISRKLRALEDYSNNLQFEMKSRKIFLDTLEAFGSDIMGYPNELKICNKSEKECSNSTFNDDKKSLQVSELSDIYSALASDSEFEMEIKKSNFSSEKLTMVETKEKSERSSLGNTILMDQEKQKTKKKKLSKTEIAREAMAQKRKIRMRQDSMKRKEQALLLVKDLTKKSTL